MSELPLPEMDQYIVIALQFLRSSFTVALFSPLSSQLSCQIQRQPLSPRMHQLVLTINTRKPVCTAPTMADREEPPPPQENQQQQHNPLAQEWQAAHEQTRDGHAALAAYYDRLSNLPPPGVQGTLQDIQRSLDGIKTDILNIQQFLCSL